MIVRHWFGWLFSFVLLVVCLGEDNPAEAQTPSSKVALVIGNGTYVHAGSLKNASADARLLSKTLTDMGFSVTTVLDADKRTFETTLRTFARTADAAGVAVVYFAGHGIEVGGLNYLIPTDAVLSSERDLSFEAIALDVVLEAVAETRGLKLVMLDACRDNPFRSRMRRLTNSRSSTVSQGLAEVDVSGALVLYAARAGTTASDGIGDNSPFAEALARRLPRPGVDVRLLVGQVRDDVLAATADAQEPFSYGSLPGVALTLVDGPGETGFGVSVGDPAEASELALWREALAVDSLEAYLDYLRQYPKGRFAVVAQSRLDRLRARLQASLPQPLQVLQARGFLPAPESLFSAIQAGDLEALAAFSKLPNKTALMISALNLTGDRGQNRFRVHLETTRSAEVEAVVKALAQFTLPPDLAVVDVALNRLDAVSNRIDVEFRSTLLSRAYAANNAWAFRAMLSSRVSTTVIVELGDWGVNAYSTLQPWRMLRDLGAPGELAVSIADLLARRRSYGVLLTDEALERSSGRLTGGEENGRADHRQLPEDLKARFAPQPSIANDVAWYCTADARTQRGLCDELLRNPALVRAKYKGTFDQFEIKSYLGDLDGFAYFVISPIGSDRPGYFSIFLARGRLPLNELEMYLHSSSGGSSGYWDPVVISRVE
ncbi:hypothetical protein GC169_03600 [bacterium]|nr:hypothetical protein [bacterium]